MIAVMPMNFLTTNLRNIDSNQKAPTWLRDRDIPFIPQAAVTGGTTRSPDSGGVDSVGCQLLQNRRLIKPEKKGTSCRGSPSAEDLGKQQWQRRSPSPEAHAFRLLYEKL